MSKHFLPNLIATVLTLVLGIGDCDRDPEETKQAFKSAMQELMDEEPPFFNFDGPGRVVPPMHAYETNFQGHTYISFNAEHGLSVVHDPDCQCLKGDK